MIADAQAIPMRFLENILAELRVHGLVHSRRGSDGGYWLAQAPDEITLAEVIRAVEGPLATVRGEAPDELEYPAGCEPLRDVWLALRANVRGVLESVTVADVVAGELPAAIRALSQRPEARDRELTSDPRRRPFATSTSSWRKVASSTIANQAISTASIAQATRVARVKRAPAPRSAERPRSRRTRGHASARRRRSGRRAARAPRPARG